MRAPRASDVITSIAIGVAVLTVLVSALAVRAGDDPFAYAGRRFPAWLIVVGLIVVGLIVAGLLGDPDPPGGIQWPGGGNDWLAPSAVGRLVLAS